MAKAGNQTTTTSTSAPWGPAQSYIKTGLSEADKLYQSGEGFNPYPGSTVTPFSDQTTSALGQIEGLAGQGNPLGVASQNQALDVIGSGGMSDWQRSALGGTYDVATGGKQIGTEGDLRGLLGQASNPYYEGLVNKQAEQLGTDIQRNVDALGRRGSGYNVNEIAQGVGDFREKALSDQYNQSIANQRGILGDISGVQGTNIGNVVGAGQSIFGAGDTASGRAAQYAGLAPSIYEQQYAPAERLASVGAQNEDLATRQLQDQIDRYYMTQQAPWNALSNYSALISGAGQLGGTQSQTAQGPTNYAAPLGGAVSGATLGSLFGPIGTGVGAVGGGLLGLLGLA